MYYIYKITCIITNKNYIGKSTIPISKRWNRHLRDSQKLDTHLARAMKLYGTENFFIEEIDSCEELVKRYQGEVSVSLNSNQNYLDFEVECFYHDNGYLVVVCKANKEQEQRTINTYRSKAIKE